MHLGLKVELGKFWCKFVAWWTPRSWEVESYQSSSTETIPFGSILPVSSGYSVVRKDDSTSNTREIFPPYDTLNGQRAYSRSSATLEVGGQEPPLRKIQEVSLHRWLAMLSPLSVALANSKSCSTESAGTPQEASQRASPNFRIKVRLWLENERAKSVSCFGSVISRDAPLSSYSNIQRQLVEHMVFSRATPVTLTWAIIYHALRVVWCWRHHRNSALLRAFHQTFQTLQTLNCTLPSAKTVLKLFWIFSVLFSSEHYSNLHYCDYMYIVLYCLLTSI